MKFSSGSSLNYEDFDSNTKNKQNDCYTIGSKDVEVNHGSPIENYNLKDSPLKYFSKNKKLDRDDSGSNNKCSTKKEINVPIFPDLNGSISENIWEMNSKDFLENNRIMRHEYLKNCKKNDYNFMKEMLESINYNDEKTEFNAYNNEIIKNEEENKIIFDSFNMKNIKNENNNKINKNINPSNLKTTPEFQKYQTRLSSNKKYNNENDTLFLNKPKTYKNYDLPLIIPTNKQQKQSLKEISIRTPTEVIDENIDENLPEDLKGKISSHLMNNKSNNSRFLKTIEYNELNSIKTTPVNSDRLKLKDSDINQIFEYKSSSLENKNFKTNEYIKNSTAACLSSIEKNDNNICSNCDKPLYIFNMEVISSNCLSPIIKQKIMNLLRNNLNDLKVISSNESIPEKSETKNLKTKSQNHFRNKSMIKYTDFQKSNQRKLSLNNLHNQNIEEIFTNKKICCHSANPKNLSINLGIQKNGEKNQNDSLSHIKMFKNNQYLDQTRKKTFSFHRKTVSNLIETSNTDINQKNQNIYLKHVKPKQIVQEFQNFKALKREEKNQNSIFYKKDLSNILEKKNISNMIKEINSKKKLHYKPC